MATDLHVYGPFEIPCDKDGPTKWIEPAHGRQFWETPNVYELRHKQGCYVFALRAGQGFTPWYVGKAGKSFAQEIFAVHKRNYYNRAMHRSSCGTPVFFFVAPPGGKKKVRARDLNHMEKELIQFAAKRNPDLCNVQNTKTSPQWTIKGVIRSPQGRPNAAARQFKKMMRA